MSRRKVDYVLRFWNFVDKKGPEECWPWTGASVKNYGVLVVDGKRLSAHRISFKLHNEENIDGLMVRHMCNNPICVNPAHLLSGTARDNAQDCVRAGRKNSLRKLDDETMALIRVASGTNREVAARFNISMTRAGDVRRGDRCRLTLPGPPRLKDFDAIAVEAVSPNSCKGCILEFSTLRECNNSVRTARSMGIKTCDDFTPTGSSYIFIERIKSGTDPAATGSAPEHLSLEQ